MAWKLIQTLGQETTIEMRKLAMKYEGFHGDDTDFKYYVEQRCTQLTTQFLGFQLTRAYLDEYINPYTKVEVKSGHLN